MVAMGHLALSIKKIREHHLRGQEQRQGKENDDDRPVDPVVPWAVDPAVTKQCVIVEKKLKEDDGGRKNEPGKNLHTDDDQLQRHPWDENNTRGRGNGADIDGIELRRLPEFLVQ